MYMYSILNSLAYQLLQYVLQWLIHAFVQQHPRFEQDLYVSQQQQGHSVTQRQ